ncbi:putative nuclease HARBI1 [Ochlerotatus camptorhynchus]|uniref:putative nuclease HARBI1 n=1 Tax=Ochlerotatus camptorhynchus TaxID=644619 RepID=UPI0031D38AAC
MSVELWFDTDSEDEEEYSNLAVDRRRISDNSNPLDQTEKSFIQFFRVSKEILKYLLEIIDAKINPVQLSTSVPPMIMLAASLRFFAEGNYQKGVGNDRFIGLAQPTMSKVLQLVLDIIETEVCPAVIQFPFEERETNAIKLGFYDKTGFPGVIVCVHGTHVSIIPLARDKHLFYRGGRHILNLNSRCSKNLTLANKSSKNLLSFLASTCFAHHLFAGNLQYRDKSSFYLLNVRAASHSKT